MTNVFFNMCAKDKKIDDESSLDELKGKRIKQYNPLVGSLYHVYTRLLADCNKCEGTHPVSTMDSVSLSHIKASL